MISSSNVKSELNMNKKRYKKIYKYIGCVFLCIFGIIGYKQAYSLSDFDIDKIQAQSDHMVNSIHLNASTINKSMYTTNNAYNKYVDSINMDNIVKSNSIHKANPDIIVFVSLSMPDQLLKQLFTEASKRNIPVVVRGLYKNSFKGTASRIFNITKNKKVGGVLVNPIWFQQYRINSVPTVVVARKGKPCREKQYCSNNQFDSVSGNISISKALEIITQHQREAVDE